MKLTNEQSNIISAEGNIVVDAVAGSGKTSTCIKYAEARPDKKFLYTCFNRSIREYAEEKFPDNVEVRTIHSLAYRYTNAGQWNIVNNFELSDVLSLLKIRKRRNDPNYHLILGSHILTGLNTFFGSSERSINDFNYINYNYSEFIEDNIDNINTGIVKLYNMMMDGKCPIVHNFYLKQFQLQDPILDYDYIIYDEAQDANICMMEVFNQQECNKLTVGDICQSIYGWNMAKDALLKFKALGYQDYKLTNSFRFRQDIGDLASRIINMKRHIDESHELFSMTSLGNSNSLNTHAYVARSNITLIEKSINYAVDDNKTFHYEGNINSYLFSGGVSLYDVFFLWNGDMNKVNNKLLKGFDSYDDYKKFLDETSAPDQKVFCKLVEKYKWDIFNIVKSIKKSNVDKDKADIILTTTHKCKGMEYDTVELAHDFIKESAVLDSNPEDAGKLNEEINILYVATTRAKNKLKFPKFLLTGDVELNESKFK